MARGMTRRGILFGLPAALAACQTNFIGQLAPGLTIYGPVFGEPFPVPAVNLSYVHPIYYRTTVRVPAGIPDTPGEIVVDPGRRFLYHVQDGGLATRYGIGVGREGFGWSGHAVIGRKAEWPSWTPPASMVARDPAARRWAGGMPGGENNPLGARALYLYQGGRDTLYRLHGTIEPWSIGQAVSSGCIRLLNQDIIHLYERVPVGTRVTVLPA
jgi:lipoprotein-anchoring transpeptidase ErfK/SrfK